ncbi:hypothetical protein CEUSTIGMA_g4050.t1 [Chlamydomonas eustigma]|uniref:Uncharacterized protein n=1 Tax=Chlamydomonas eustigma TaxID=1157962 RepID=A0A250X0I3_9CHLO|nr:hypothetical protein CEUSTIGMA_g4050.t1 [Chlamydomonas eustigma]|eukprot:GAX76604.1 hypothetical protein CEUSTIGMA_g4050.t1 [Chlamydomonas eustigma]
MAPILCCSEVVTGDPAAFRRIKWGRLVNGEDVAVILNHAYDSPLLPPSNEALTSPLYLKGAQEWFNQLPDGTAKSILNMRHSMLHKLKAQTMPLGRPTRPADLQPASDVMGLQGTPTDYASGGDVPHMYHQAGQQLLGLVSNNQQGGNGIIMGTLGKPHLGSRTKIKAAGKGYPLYPLPPPGQPLPPPVSVAMMAPVFGPDGKPIIGTDGQPVMQVIQQASSSGEVEDIGPIEPEGSQPWYDRANPFGTFNFKWNRVDKAILEKQAEQQAALMAQQQQGMPQDQQAAQQQGPLYPPGGPFPPGFRPPITGLATGAHPFTQQLPPGFLPQGVPMPPPGSLGLMPPPPYYRPPSSFLNNNPYNMYMPHHPPQSGYNNNQAGLYQNMNNGMLPVGMMASNLFSQMMGVQQGYGMNHELQGHAQGYGLNQGLQSQQGGPQGSVVNAEVQQQRPYQGLPPAQQQNQQQYNSLGPQLQAPPQQATIPQTIQNLPQQYNSIPGQQLMNPVPLQNQLQQYNQTLSQQMQNSVPLQYLPQQYGQQQHIAAPSSAQTQPIGGPQQQQQQKQKLIGGPQQQQLQQQVGGPQQQQLQQQVGGPQQQQQQQVGGPQQQQQQVGGPQQQQLQQQVGGPQQQQQQQVGGPQQQQQQVGGPQQQQQQVGGPQQQQLQMASQASMVGLQQQQQAPSRPAGHLPTLHTAAPTSVATPSTQSSTSRAPAASGYPSASQLPSISGQRKVIGNDDDDLETEELPILTGRTTGGAADAAAAPKPTGVSSPDPRPASVLEGGGTQVGTSPTYIAASSSATARPPTSSSKEGANSLTSPPVGNQAASTTSITSVSSSNQPPPANPASTSSGVATATVSATNKPALGGGAAAVATPIIISKSPPTVPDVPPKKPAAKSDMKEEEYVYSEGEDLAF